MTAALVLLATVGLSGCHVISPPYQREHDPDNPPAEADDFDLATSASAKGDSTGTARHLRSYLAKNPDHFVMRAMLADVLVRLGRPGEAKAEYERVVADVQDGPASAKRELLRYHTTLMELAADAGDAYGEHFHRGAGLYRLAEQLTASDADAGDIEIALCKAAKEFRRAGEFARTRPGRTGTCTSSGRSWTNRNRPTRLSEARAKAKLTELTPAEFREMSIR